MKNYKISALGFILIIGLLGGWLSGCSSTQKTVRIDTKTKVVKQADQESFIDNDDQEIIVEETTTTESLKKKKSGGILSSSVNFVGEVLSAPFRFVGWLIRSVF